MTLTLGKSREERFLDLVNSHKELVAKVCFLYSGPGAPAEDLYQEVMANIWEGLDSFRGEAKVSTWMYRMAINTCITWHRRNDRHSRERVSLEDLISEPADMDSSAELVAGLRSLHALISCLNPVEKALISLWLEDKPYEEIAAIVGISKANVAVRIHRIKEKLSQMAKT